MTAARLDDWSLLRFTGADAPGFLHGQLTCDVLALKPGSSTYGGCCNPKGRLLATFLLWMDADGYTMLLPAPVAEAVRKRLTMYVLRSKVKIDDITQQQACIGISGSDAAGDIAALGGAVPAKLHGVTFNGKVTVIRLPQQRHLLVTPQVPAGIGHDDGAWIAADVAAGKNGGRVVTRFRNTLGLPGTLSIRLQPNHPTDDPKGIAAAILHRSATTL